MFDWWADWDNGDRIALVSAAVAVVSMFANAVNGSRTKKAARADRNAAEEAAKTAKDHADAAQRGALAAEDQVQHVDRIAKAMEALASAEDKGPAWQLTCSLDGNIRRRYRLENRGEGPGVGPRLEDALWYVPSGAAAIPGRLDPGKSASLSVAPPSEGAPFPTSVTLLTIGYEPVELLLPEGKGTRGAIVHPDRSSL